MSTGVTSADRDHLQLHIIVNIFKHLIHTLVYSHETVDNLGNKKVSAGEGVNEVVNMK